MSAYPDGRARRLLDLLHPDDTVAAVAYLKEAFANPGETQRVEWRLRHNDGGWVPVEAPCPQPHRRRQHQRCRADHARRHGA
ncbi:MAG: PAS domain-containing protein [Actinomycetota bacterium]|nr:PAS domain-containing protein [Actinomycetota bacterium]